VKNIGKPCAGKLQARFDEGGLVKGISSLLYPRSFATEAFVLSLVSFLYQRFMTEKDEEEKQEG
jgi:hypothetical protein